MSAESEARFGRREVAYRVFATEYDDATLEYSEEDDDRAPNYVVSPTGARINRLFAVGVLTEIEPVSSGVLRARIVDPTGALVSYAGQYQPDAVSFLERAEPPEFVALTGKARTFQPEDSDRVFSSVRPETINAVDAGTRDRWTVTAAEQTLERIDVCAAAIAREERGDELEALLAAAGIPAGLAAGVPRALDHYGTTRGYLAGLREITTQALEVVAGDRGEVEAPEVSPAEPGGTDIGLGGEWPGRLEAAAAAATAEPASGSLAPAEPAAREPEAAETEPAEEPTGCDEADSVEPDEAPDEPAAEAGTGTDTEPAGASEASSENAGVAGADGGDEGLGDFDDFGQGEHTDAVETEELYEFDDGEREAIEEEFGTEFSPAGDVDAPEEPADEADPEVTEEEEEPPEPEPESEPADDDTAGSEPADDEDAAGGSLEDAVIEAMRDLDDGDGAAREVVVEAVVSERSADPAAVDEAIDDALMSGRCYEPTEGRFKAI